MDFRSAFQVTVKVEKQWRLKHKEIDKERGLSRKKQRTHKHKESDKGRGLSRKRH